MWNESMNLDSKESVEIICPNTTSIIAMPFALSIHSILFSPINESVLNTICISYHLILMLMAHPSKKMMHIWIYL